MTEHRPEELVIEHGPRTGLPVVIAVDSTVGGPAFGGCRIRRYPDRNAAVVDAVRLAGAMTEKTALAGLPCGGGKTVVALPPDGSAAIDLTDPAQRDDLFADVGDVVATLDGRYVTGPDIGSGPDDMVRIGRHTRHVLCRPEAAGGSGDSSGPTALGVLAALDALRAHRWPGRPIAQLRVAVHGLGQVVPGWRPSWPARAPTCSSVISIRDGGPMRGTGGPAGSTRPHC